MERMDEFAKKYPQYANLMPVRESIYKLDRLQGLQYSVYMAEAEIAGYTNEQMTEYLTKLSQKGVNYGMEMLGFGENFYSINSDVVKQFVDVPWCNGENFSTRIWNDTQKLAQYLSQDLAQGFARGDSYDKLVRNLRQRFGRVNRKDAYRLAYTEGTYVMAEATMQPFKDNFEKYRLSPVLDGKTCPICRGLREQVFLISERQPGVNFPPIHPWCRCSWEIVVDDWDAWMDEYVAKHSGDRKQAEKIATRLTENIRDDDYQERIKRRRDSYRKRKQEEITNVFGDEIVFDEKMSDPSWKESKDMLLKLTNQYRTRLRTVSPGAYKAAGEVDMGGNMRLSSSNLQTVIHEFAHSITIQDLTKYGITNDSEFWKELRKIRTKYRRDVGNDVTRWISSYEHSNKALDEFFAEAFTHAKMKELGIRIPDIYGKDFTYSDEVLKLTNKYFGKSIAKSSDSGIIKRKRGTLKLDLQFFAEKDIKKQQSGSLKRAIRRYQARIEEHEAKIKNPKEIYPEWDTYDPRYQDGLKRHWNKEIRNFKQSIQDRVDELKERGDYDE